MCMPVYELNFFYAGQPGENYDQTFKFPFQTVGCHQVSKKYESYYDKFQIYSSENSFYLNFRESEFQLDSPILIYHIQSQTKKTKK